MAEHRPWHRRLRQSGAHLYGRPAAVFNSVDYLANAKYLLLESETPDGTAVATTMLFAAVDDTIFLRTRADSAKLVRIHHRPIVKVAACTMRGQPRDDYIECVARVAAPAGEAEAQAALHRGYRGWHRLLSRFARGEHRYLELTPVLVKRGALVEVQAPARTRVGAVDGGLVQGRSSPGAA
jgi:PPOX class probable F420-dependent enzyme